KGTGALHTKLCIGVSLLLVGPLAADEPPTVGMPARLSVVLPGPRLEAQPLDNRQAPLVVRIGHVEPVEKGFRYDTESPGLGPGRFDLGNYLRRKDGSPATGLPPVPITVQSTLPPGQTAPNPLGWPTTPRLGGYRLAVLVGAVLWGLVLLALVRTV